nr:dihydrodipicolinate synthase family protein [Actinopolymorpha pittospori]
MRGLVPILATPFDQRGALDVGSLRRLVEFVCAARVDGIATFGMASEGFALTGPERETVLATITDVADPDLLVVAGVNATSTATALEQAAAARDGGADALMVLPPYLVKPSAAQIVDFYGSVAQGSGLPVMVQDAPNATAVTMPTALIVELSKLDGVTSVKVEAPPTAPKVAAVAEAVEAGFAVLGGQNAFFLLEEYAAGAVGTMPACEFVDPLREVLDLWTGGDRASARSAFTRLLPLIRFGMQGPLAWAVHKEVLVQRGVIQTAVVRAPAAPLDSRTSRFLSDILTDLRLPAFQAS